MASLLKEMALAIPLVLGGHELGHYKEGREAGLPMMWKDNVSHSPYDVAEYPNEFAKMFSGGPEGQDLAVELGKEFGLRDTMPLLVSGLNKIGYAMFPNGINNENGDVSNLKNVKGKKAEDVMQAALVISGLDDLYKSKTGNGMLGKNIKLSFRPDTKTGSPMLFFEKRFE